MLDGDSKLAYIVPMCQSHGGAHRPVCYIRREMPPTPCRCSPYFGNVQFAPVGLAQFQEAAAKAAAKALAARVDQLDAAGAAAAAAAGAPAVAVAVAGAAARELVAVARHGGYLPLPADSESLV